MGCCASSGVQPQESVVVPAQAAGDVAEQGPGRAATPSSVVGATRSLTDVLKSTLGPAKPVWSRQILSSGADKDIFAGTYRGRKVAVCIAKRPGGGCERIQNEISVFKTLGSHPHIIEMYCNGIHNGSVYFALEIVEPIGYDLDRLKNMYAFARQAVPSSLMARIFAQLAGALGHMHKRGLIHRDLKTENVLVDAKHNAKLIDMGIACKIGKRDSLRAGYLAPELCQGMRPLGVAVDSWGLGLVLHQVYQNQWKVLTESGPVEMLEGKPSKLRPMEKPVRDAMCGLLRLAPADRWTLKQLLACEWLKSSVSQEASPDWQRPAAAGEDTERRHLRHYKSSRPLPTALAVFITRKNHRHLIGQPISALGLSSGLGITVLLMSSGKGTFESRPGAETPIRENTWVYFGVPQGEGPMAQAVEGLEAILSSGAEDSHYREKSGSPNDFRALCRREVVETGKLVEFTVEFDCFAFPGHIGAEAMIGAAKPPGTPTTAGSTPPSAVSAVHVPLPPRNLELRKNFGLNLVGIQRIGDDDPEWFPRASAVVKPDDLGLVVRLPCLDGSTEPTVTDSDLERLMNKESFNKVVKGDEA